jgi:hypothetical protein
MREHIPKRHLDFENPVITDKVFDNTNARIYGGKITTNMMPTSHDWGTGRNPAQEIPRVGLKTQAFEQQIAAQVAQEMKQKHDA